MTATTTLPKKLPDEDVYVDFDFTNLFDTGVTISTPTFTITEKITGVAANVNMKNGPPKYLGMVASQLVSNGTAGETYLVEMHVLGSDGSSQSIMLYLPVVAKRLG